MVWRLKKGYRIWWLEFTAVLQDSMFFPIISYIMRLQENKEWGDAEEVEAVHTKFFKQVLQWKKEERRWEEGARNICIFFIDEDNFSWEGAEGDNN